MIIEDQDLRIRLSAGVAPVSLVPFACGVVDPFVFSGIGRPGVEWLAGNRPTTESGETVADQVGEPYTRIIIYYPARRKLG